MNQKPETLSPLCPLWFKFFEVRNQNPRIGLQNPLIGKRNPTIGKRKPRIGKQKAIIGERNPSVFGHMLIRLLHPATFLRNGLGCSQPSLEPAWYNSW